MWILSDGSSLTFALSRSLRAYLKSEYINKLDGNDQSTKYFPSNNG